MTEPLRLSKCVVEQFNCSRREAELLIEGGWVMVDGTVVEEPQHGITQQIITLHPDANVDPVPPATLLLHKPAGLALTDALALITPSTRCMTDTSRVRALKKHFHRLQAVLPLDTAACGLQVFTQDYRVVRKLTDDAYKTEQEYSVEVQGSIHAGGLALLNHGLTLDGMALAPAKASWQSEQRLRLALKYPRPEQIHKMCAAVGLHATVIKRIRIGRIPMANLVEGQWRYLPFHERF